MPISCHFRDSKALLVTRVWLVYKMRYSKYRTSAYTFTFTAIIFTTHTTIWWTWCHRASTGRSRRLDRGAAWVRRGMPERSGTWRQRFRGADDEYAYETTPTTPQHRLTCCRPSMNWTMTSRRLRTPLRQGTAQVSADVIIMNDYWLLYDIEVMT